MKKKNKKTEEKLGDVYSKSLQYKFKFYKILWPFFVITIGGSFIFVQFPDYLEYFPIVILFLFLIGGIVNYVYYKKILKK